MKNFSIVTILGGLLCAASFAATGKDASAIVRTGEQRIRGNSTQAIMRMEISRPEFSRKLKLRAWTVGKAKSLVQILEPAKEEGVMSLRLETQMWNYLPKTDQVIRVPSSLMLQSWMGSDFTNDDLMKASSLVTDYTHKTLRNEKLNGEPAVLIECTPKPDAPVVWGKILYWARTSDDLPVKQEYYDEKGKLVRTLRMSGFRKMDDRVIPAELTMVKAENPAETTKVTYEKILYDRKFDESVFERERLRRTSQLRANL